MFNTNKEKQALKKIKNLQKFLNKYFPETLPEEKPDRFKFVEAEDFLSEEARLWNDSRKQNSTK
tara:strand:- start:7823 stop:8014 length:192 start_codon:yes stop_codon:yes gene_type:complete